jgi:nucleotide-binding universal stress UspA family protein
MEVEAAPTWKGIVKVAEDEQASLIVLGSHRRSGIIGHLLGSVSAAVVAHSAFSVLVVHQGSEALRPNTCPAGRRSFQD